MFIMSKYKKEKNSNIINIRINAITKIQFETFRLLNLHKTVGGKKKTKLFALKI
jgi:hypothetical protein